MKKTVAPGARTPLFDRIFKPELITLENGHTVTRPRSRTPLIALLGGNAAVAGGVRYLLVVLFAGCVWPLTFWWFGRLGRR